MAFEHYSFEGTKRLRCGYTTGSCAALAAQAATRMLLGQQEVHWARIVTPKGIPVKVSVLEQEFDSESAHCAVRKDAGDDFDVTDGMLIFATAGRIDSGISIDGGEGIGRVTLPGLDQPVGEAAINHVPREMIEHEVESVCRDFGYDGGISIVVSAPEGMEISKKTFNSRIGIKGGISVLGTTGIVEPQSLKALLDCIEVEVKARATQSKRLVITPGSYGEAFLREFKLPEDVPEVKCSNFIGDTLDFCSVYGVEQVLLVSHIGKLSKVAGGIMNTHSRVADCRTEIFCAHAACAGADTETCKALMEAATTDACIEILDGVGLRDEVLARICGCVQDKLDHRAGGAFEVGAVSFSNKYGYLFATEVGDKLVREWRSV
ncbi:MAG: cobalt-precorrin-5B (C(1))-methyltransferase CbiD [Coriobacteriales bacterium]|jgi:cobalt-precorrin-5B (C1)-methyltransferase